MLPVPVYFLEIKQQQISQDHFRKIKSRSPVAAVRVCGALRGHAPLLHVGGAERGSRRAADSCAPSARPSHLSLRGGPYRWGRPLQEIPPAPLGSVTSLPHSLSRCEVTLGRAFWFHLHGRTSCSGEICALLAASWRKGEKVAGCSQSAPATSSPTWRPHPQPCRDQLTGPAEDTGHLALHGAPSPGVSRGQLRVPHLNCTHTQALN